MYTYTYVYIEYFWKDSLDNKSNKSRGVRERNSQFSGYYLQYLLIQVHGRFVFIIISHKNNPSEKKTK